MPEAAIQVLDVVKKFGARTVLDQVRLDVFKGETLVILGG
jgi:ABC-type transporter Mla maintaining outer membrane lipid asymmetry ATPase subunit MlaF